MSIPGRYLKGQTVKDSREKRQIYNVQVYNIDKKSEAG
jgi:hypothetical protein